MLLHTPSYKYSYTHALIHSDTVLDTYTLTHAHTLTHSHIHTYAFTDTCALIHICMLALPSYTHPFLLCSRLQNFPVIISFSLKNDSWVMKKVSVKCFPVTHACPCILEGYLLPWAMDKSHMERHQAESWLPDKSLRTWVAQRIQGGWGWAYTFLGSNSQGFYTDLGWWATGFTKKSSMPERSEATQSWVCSFTRIHQVPSECLGAGTWLWFAEQQDCSSQWL